MPAPDPSDEIVERLLADLDRGVATDIAALKRAFPGHDETVERLWRAGRDYHELVRTTRRADEVIELQRGMRLGDFEIESVLARGGSSVVYRAQQRSLGGRRVALKVVRFDSADDRARRQFEREALIAATLHDEHLAEVYGFGVEGSWAYCAMQWIEGPTLRDVLERACVERGSFGPAERRRVVERCCEVASALAKLHERGLVHRDVKPGNVVLRAGASEGEIVPTAAAVLVDLGLVRACDRDTATQTRVSAATPRYAAPEQLLGSEVDARADVFALGATLHDLLVPREPTQRAQASLGLEPLRTLVPDLDRDLEAIVARACDADASGRWRYRDASELHSDLVAWLAGMPVRARRLGRVESFARWTRRAEVRAAARTVLVLASLVAASFVVGRGSTLMSEVEAIESARRDGLLPAFVASSHVPSRSIFARALLDRDVLADVDAVHRRGGDPAWTELLPLFETDDVDGARRAAVRVLAKRRSLDDAGWDPLLSDWLARDIEHAPVGAASTLSVLEPVARLFLEVPDASIAHRRDSTPLRLALRARRAALSAPTRSAGMHRAEVAEVHSALSGCGDHEDALAIAKEMNARAWNSEDQRAGWFAVARILVRSGACEFAKDVDLALVRRELVASIERGWSFLDRVSHGRLDVAHLEALIVTCTIERLARGTSSIDWMPTRLRERLAKPLPEHVETALLLRAAAGDADVLAEVNSRWSWIEPPRAIARALALLGGDEVLDPSALSERLATHEWIERYRDGWRQGDFERRCAGDHRRLDLASLLTEEAPPLRVAIPTTVTPFAARGASWTFDEECCRVGGDGGPAEHVLARRDSDGPNEYYALSRSGVSALHLPFVVCDAADWTSHGVLLLESQRSARDMLPGEGVARIDIEIDGVRIVAEHSVQHSEGCFEAIHIPRVHLTVGEHELTIRLSSSSRAPCRVFSAAVVPRDPAWPLHACVAGAK